LVVSDLPTDWNVADIGTRPDKVYDEKDRELRVLKTVELMRKAVERWRLTAEEYITRPEDGATDELDSAQEPDESYLW